MNIQEILSTQEFKLAQSVSGVNIVVIGCGGTGSKLIRDLCQAMAATKRLLPELPIMALLADHDVVEKKNRDRQNFTDYDVGQLKSVCLAERYTEAFGIPIKAVTKIVDSHDDLAVLINSGFETEVPLTGVGHYRNGSYGKDTLVITCVDNHQTRKLVSEYFLNHAPVYWLDLGNEATTGQFCVGFNSPADRWNYEYISRFDLPCSTELFPDILEAAGDIKPSDLPCGEGGAQELNVNAVMASTAMSWICSYFRAIVNIQSNTTARDPKLTKVCNYYSVSIGIDPPKQEPILATPQRLSKIKWGSAERQLRNQRRYEEHIQTQAA